MCLGHREDGARPCQHIEEEEALGRATQEGVKALVCNAWGGGEFTSSPAPRGGGTPRCGEEQELNFVGTWRRKVLEETGMLREAKGLPRRQMEEALGEKEFNLAGWKYGRLAGIHGDIYASPRDHICASLRNWALPIADPLFKTRGCICFGFAMAMHAQMDMQVRDWSWSFSFQVALMSLMTQGRFTSVHPFLFMRLTFCCWPWING
uniref:Uncharacterized protein n=1 Tax=Oryza rufipogon TaxID=4529 RepID=A0A0E0QF84_ORYRU